MHKIVIIVLGLFTSLVSCEPGDLINIPVNKPRLVVLANPENEQPWMVFISHTEPITGTATHSENIENASVKIYEDNEFIEQLVFNSNVIDSLLQPYTLSPYTGNTKPAVGRTYKVVVDADGYETASASYSQLPEIEIQHLDIDVTGVSVKQQSADFKLITKTVEIAVTFTDPAGDNFYWFDLSGVPSSDTVPNYYSSLFITSTDPLYSSDQSLYGQLITDQNFKDSKVTLKFRTAIETNLFVNDTIAINRLRFSVRNVNKDLYDFRWSTTRPGTFSYDPYVQPTTLRSNIHKGIGVFAGFTTTKKEIEYDPY